MGLLASDAEKVIAVTAEAELVDVPPIEAMSAEAAAFFTTPSVLVVASGTVRPSSMAFAAAKSANNVVASVKSVCDTLTDISL